MSVFGRTDSPESDEDLEFVYDDCDNFLIEIGELYSYTEEVEFAKTVKCYADITAGIVEKDWKDLSKIERCDIIVRAIDGTDVVSLEKRFEALSSLLYIAQGNFKEFENVEECLSMSHINCYLLFEKGVFGLGQEILLTEIHRNNKDSSDDKNPTICSIANSTEIRIILNLLYTMLETIRQEAKTEEEKELQKQLISSLEQPINGVEPLSVVLLNMVVQFCNHNVTAYPIKKILLLLWKMILAMVGGLGKLYLLKCENRSAAGLQPLSENPLDVIRKMKASAPPMNPADLFDQGQPGRRKNRRALRDLEINGKEEKITDVDIDIALDEDKEEAIENGADLLPAKVDEIRDNSDTPADVGTPFPPGTPVIGTPAPFTKDPAPSDTAAIALKLMKIKKQREEEQALRSINVIKVPSGLPWEPKTREKDIDAFLSQARQKFIGYQLTGDLTTMAGLPNPTKESIGVLKKHLYQSLADIQMKQEEYINKYPLTKSNLDVIPDNPTERLYQSLLPHLPQYMISLLKILLAAAPTSKAKTDTINILADVLPPEIPNSAVQSVKLGVDVNRHREIIVKAVSGILLLLLKHFKLNHVYQFEYMSQHLVFANCIPLVLKFFNQNIVAYVTTKNVIPSLEYPACVIGPKVELSAESLEPVDALCTSCWRNLFSSINLLRILNKLVKWKHSRTMMLVVFKSSPILKRALKVRQAMLQLYVLKLLKSQTKYLGRAWRKSNMKIMSAIYQKVRHRLSDDWAFGNDVDARPWDFQQEELTLRSQVERFNYRRYNVESPTIIPENEDNEPVDNDLHSVLGQKFELPLEFTRNYDVWLDREVYSTTTDWDQLLSIPCIQ